MTDAPVTPMPEPTFHEAVCLCKDTGFRTYMKGGNQMHRLKAMAVPSPVAYVYEWVLPCNCSMGKRVNHAMGRWEDIEGTNEQRWKLWYTEEQVERFHQRITWFDKSDEATAFIHDCHRLFVIEQAKKPKVIK